MLRIKSAARLALTIGLICASASWLATGLQIIPNPFQPIIDGRIQTTKSVAATVTTFAENQRFHDMQKVLDRVVASNDEIMSIGIVRQGRYFIEAGPHSRIHAKFEGTSLESTENYINVKIISNGFEWGRLELFFQPIQATGWRSMLVYPLPMVAFLTCSISLGTWFVLSRTFKYMNPSNVVPGRVRSAFDTLAEGLMLINNSGEIAHANLAFCKMIDRDMDQLIGVAADSLPWQFSDLTEVEDFPWNQCLSNQDSICGQIIEIAGARGVLRKYIVNATPILGEGGKSRGVLASFDDVTALESKKNELASIIHTLRRSRDEIERQNEQLNFLANYDPMTKCMNRRSFWVQYEQLWKSVEPDKLTIMMVDVDHFKSINDNHGHSVGDEVLKATGALLHEVVGDRGAVCRYGGEEFTVLCAGRDFDNIVPIAESICQEFRNRKLANIDVTVSIGLSNRAFKAMDPQHMLDQADQCLYAAKRNGRNQVVRFDQCPAESTAVEESQPDPAPSPSKSIEYSSVTGLLAALSFRSPETCQHSLRVADLALAIGGRYLKRRDLYTLEICALLHDIGKIGVPDAILNKPGPLTRDEWKIMEKHDKIGVEIVLAAFASEKIADIIAAHHSCFSVGKLGGSQSLYRDQIPLESRIITACDAFDAMVSDRVYRKGMCIDDAIVELRRCTPDQFDPEVVECLVEHVERFEYSTNASIEFSGSSKSGVKIGQHIETLCNAIEAEDVDLLQEVVENLKFDAVENQIEPIADAALRLNDAIDQNELELDQVLNLADEVMQLCRSTRTAFNTMAQDTIKNDMDQDRAEKKT